MFGKDFPPNKTRNVLRPALQSGIALHSATVLRTLFYWHTNIQKNKLLLITLIQGNIRQ